MIGIHLVIFQVRQNPWNIYVYLNLKIKENTSYRTFYFKYVIITYFLVLIKIPVFKHQKKNKLIDIEKRLVDDRWVKWVKEVKSYKFPVTKWIVMRYKVSYEMFHNKWLLHLLQFYLLFLSKEKYESNINVMLKISNVSRETNHHIKKNHRQQYFCWP